MDDWFGKSSSSSFSFFSSSTSICQLFMQNKAVEYISNVL